MKKNGYRLIADALSYMTNLIRLVACPDFPTGEFADKDIREMFYNINQMNLDVLKKLEQFDE